LLVHGVHHQRQRGQRQDLIEEIQRQKILGISDTQHHTVGHQPKSEEPVLMPLVGHIVQRVRRHQRPQHGHDGPIDHGRPVDPQGDGERLVESHHDAGQKAAPIEIGQHDTGQRQCCRCQGCRHDIDAPHPPALGLQDQQRDSQHDGNQNGQCQKLAHRRTSLLKASPLSGEQPGRQKTQPMQQAAGQQTHQHHSRGKGNHGPCHLDSHFPPLRNKI
ncbi:phosphate signaling complex protein PhoU, partial [Dysosmobacter welbionis]